MAKKVVAILQKQFERDQSNNSAFDLADELRFLTEIERNSIADNQSIDEMISYCRRALDICDNTKLSDVESKSRFIECKLNTLRSLAILYELSEDYDEALKTYNESLRLRELIIEADEDIEDIQTQIINKWRLAQLHQDIGLMQRKKGDYKSAVAELIESVEIFRELSEDTSELLPNEANAHGELALAASIFDVSLAEKHSKIEIDICQELVREDAALYELNYANALFNRVCVLTEMGSSDFDEMETLCKQAEAIYERHINAASYEVTFNYINVLYKLAGINRKKYVLDESRTYYDKAVNVASELKSISSTDYKLTLAHLFFDYGTYLTIEPNRDGLNKAVNLLKEALTLFLNTGKEGLKYVEETKGVIKAIEDVLSDESEKNIDDRSPGNSEVKKAFFNFQHFLEKGDEEEKAGHYQKACLHYKASLEQLTIIEKINGSVARLGKADLLDRLAYCCEMSQDLSEAEKCYADAAELAASEARETQDIKAVKASVSYYQKIITFLDDYGREDEANIYRDKLSELKEDLLVGGKDDYVAKHIDEEEHIVELPDRYGNKTPYKLLDVVEYKHKEYVVFVKQSVAVINRDFVLLVRVKENRNGESSYSVVTKSSLIERVYEVFRNKNKNRFTFAD